MTTGIFSAHSRESGNPVAGSPRGRAEDVVTVADVTLVADPAGALFWPEEKVLIVADLHLEKGSAFAARGVLLPPYDTITTLARLALLIEHYAPRLVIALGDSFHDGGGPARLPDISRAALTALQRGRDWLWIAGNHDPDPAENIGGRFATILALGALTFRHEPSPRANDGEIVGHLHPMARVARRGRAVSRRCFASDGRRLIMPAFGAYAGGLNVRDRAIVSVFGALSFTAHMLGAGRLYAMPAARCLAD
ncbi:MAG TPA: ligase-associated DNA damage response endonuclease PdeM [Xanthobacteraceae bacterium]|nr:ligase-associated DNA damage response endonuclease PdeM [Xanthobacteraceae bacterium]